MSSKSDDPHVGGSLSDMAVTGTKIPNDAGVQNIIPSVARPDQISSTSGADDDAGARTLAEAADNPRDIPRSTKDQAPIDDILTGTGDTLPAEVGSKHLHFYRSPDASKGDPRADVHGKQKGSHFDHEAGEGPEEEKVVDGVVGGR